MEGWTGKKAIPMAKPGQALQNLIKTKFQVSDPRRVLMVGDKYVSPFTYYKIVPQNYILLQSLN